MGSSARLARGVRRIIAMLAANERSPRAWPKSGLVCATLATPTCGDMSTILPLRLHHRAPAKTVAQPKPAGRAIVPRAARAAPASSTGALRFDGSRRPRRSTKKLRGRRDSCFLMLASCKNPGCRMDLATGEWPPCPTARRPISPLWPGVPLALASAVLFGASAPFAKLLLGSTDPQLLAGLLYLGRRRWTGDRPGGPFGAGRHGLGSAAAAAPTRRG